MVQLFYTTIISVDHAHHEIFHAKVGKGGINHANLKETALLQKRLNTSPTCKLTIQSATNPSKIE